MWLVLASDPCRKGEDLVSCLSLAVVLEGACLLEPLVCCLAVLDHVVVVAKLLLCSLVCNAHDLAEVVDLMAWLDCVCDACKDLSLAVDCCGCELNVHLDCAVLSVSRSCGVLCCAVACNAQSEAVCLEGLCIWILRSLLDCLHELCDCDGAGCEECLVCCDHVAWMWLVLSPDPCRKRCNLLACLSDDVGSECVSLLEPLVCGLAELHHVVVVALLVLAEECCVRVDCVAVHLVLGNVDPAVHDLSLFVNHDCCNCCAVCCLCCCGGVGVYDAKTQLICRSLWCLYDNCWCLNDNCWFLFCCWSLCYSWLHLLWNNFNYWSWSWFCLYACSDLFSKTLGRNRETDEQSHCNDNKLLHY